MILVRLSRRNQWRPRQRLHEHDKGEGATTNGTGPDRPQRSSCTAS
jgi:hypothetical protein